MNLLAEWARNLGATFRQSADDAALNKRFDVGIHGSPAKLILDDLGGGRQSSVPSEAAVGSNTNSKLQFFIIVGNETFAGLVHPYFTSRGRRAGVAGVGSGR